VKDNKVVARTLPNAAPAAPPIQAADLGPEWREIRRAVPNADNLLVTVISAVSNGKQGAELSHKLASWNEQMRFNFDSEQQIINAYEHAVSLLQTSIAKDLVKVDSRIKADKAFDVVNFILEQMHPSDRTSLLLRKLHGDQTYLQEFNKAINKQIRKEADEKKNQKK
jgi:hypothetical protein